mgnify:CR=1 FL=1
MSNVSEEVFWDKMKVLMERIDSLLERIIKLEYKSKDILTLCKEMDIRKQENINLKYQIDELIMKEK